MSKRVNLALQGGGAAAAWLDNAYEHIGTRSTVDLRAEFLGEVRTNKGESHA